MPLALSVENEISQFLAKHNLDGMRFCQIVGDELTPTSLSQARNDIRPLDSVQSAAARKTMKAIDHLVELTDPLPLSLRNPTIVRKLLKSVEDNLLKISVEIFAEDWEKV